MYYSSFIAPAATFAPPTTMVLAAPIEQAPVYAVPSPTFQFKEDALKTPAHLHGKQRGAGPEPYPHQHSPMYHHHKDRAPLPSLGRGQPRPYAMAQPGCVPADILQECSNRMADILDNNPPAAYLDFYHGDMAYVDHNLFLGSYRHAENGSELVRQGITHVLNCARSCCPNHDENFYAPHNLAVMSLDASDTAEFPLMHLLFDKAFDFLEKCSRSPKAKCLIHCYQGLNRSATLCVAYLMVKHRLPLLTVVERVHAVRAYILGNPGFRQQLIEFAYVNDLLFETGRHPAPLKSPNHHRNGLPFGPKKRKPVEAAAVAAAPVAAAAATASPVQQPAAQLQHTAPTPIPMVAVSPVLVSPNIRQSQNECGYKSLREVPAVPNPLEKKGRLVRMVASLKDMAQYQHGSFSHHFGALRGQSRRDHVVAEAPPSPVYAPATPVQMSSFRVAA
eukprot:GGOE01054036.1.p1 GENE.GGOE01054036.1~~GGOE01054036.1.p1  ORF type:complete len:474 (+),score=101.57 GGOE01054036.1:83-1423(+)